MPGDTGVGATLTLSGGFSASYREVGAVRAGIEDVDNNTLDNASPNPAKFLPGDNPVYEDIACVVRYNPTSTQPVIGAIQTITITPPKENTGSASPCNIAGSGYVKSFDKIPNLQRNQLNVANMVLRFDGNTGPTFTPES